VKLELIDAKAFVVPPAGQRWIVQIKVELSVEAQRGIQAALRREFADNPPVLFSAGLEVLEAGS
jgi:hypothetical protein